MITFSIQSGSNGNAFYVESSDVRLLFDAGVSASTTEKRMALHGRDIRQVDALILSHEHTDHTRSAGAIQRKFGIPIHVTQRTHDAAWSALGELHDVRYFRSGASLDFGRVVVHTIRTAHDAVDGVAFVVEGDGKRLGVLTDLGHPGPALQRTLESVDAAYLECNYDTDLLDASSYPARLKARIRGKGGHLSNTDAAELLRACGRKRPRWVAAAHLSQHNNRPELAIAAQHHALGRDYPVHLASRDACSDVLEV